MFQLTANEQAVGECAQYTQRKLVMHDIRHLNTFFHLPEMMLVMPELIGPAALLIHEVMSGNDMRDLRHPVDPKAGEWRELVFYQLTGIHVPGLVS